MWRFLLSVVACPVLQVAAAGAPAVAGDLGILAYSSARPPECAPSPESGGAPAVNVWDAARDARLQRYCELVAAGMSQLAAQPEGARARAEQAEQVLPGHAAPWVLRGRASVLLGRYPQAALEFARARRLEPRSLDDVLTARAYARSLASTGHASEALDAYRTAMPQLSTLSADERAEVLLEGALVGASVGPSASAETIAWLRDARRLAPRELARRAAALLALSLDRAGASDEAAAVAVELVRRRGQDAESGEAPSALEQIAAAAFVAEHYNVRAARAAWQRYLSTLPSDAPYRAHAEQRLAVLRRGADELSARPLALARAGRRRAQRGTDHLSVCGRRPARAHLVGTRGGPARGDR